jgi:hypothetical protein
MSTLFENNENFKKETSLKIVKKNQKTLSKNQQLFNNLTKRIENLEEEIKNEKDKLDRLVIFYSKKLEPLNKEIGDLRIKLAMALANSTNILKFTKKQLENITDAILQLCTDAFVQIEPNPEQIAFYDSWAETSYKDELHSQAEEHKDMFVDMMKDMHGIDLNLDDIDMMSDDISEVQAKIMEQVEKSKQNELKEEKKKTKKQLKIEAEQKAEEDIKNRSLRSIYIALAKVIHPDTETDLTLKAEKEEIMKQVTTAYDRKDLPALLKLEIEWVIKESEHLEKLTEEKLKIYISALKQQAQELEQEKRMLYMHPRYLSIMDIAVFNEKAAMRRMQQEIAEQNKAKNYIINFTRDFEQPNAKKQILEFIKGFKSLKEPDFDIQMMIKELLKL